MFSQIMPQHFVLFLLLFGTGAQRYGQAEVGLVHTFPVGSWVENLAVRKNGLILTTLASSPWLYQVDPHNEGLEELVSTIPGHTALAGITEVEPDVFYVGANNFTVNPPSLQQNASAIYRIDVGQYKFRIPLAPILVADFPLSGLLNGLTTLDSKKGLILVADAGKGWVWRLNVWTGEKKIVISDPLMQIVDATKEPIGVNGLKIHDGFLYWSNTNQELLAKTPITKDGFPTGAASVVTHYATPDDILFPFGFHDPDGILAAGNDTIRFVNETEVRVLSDSDLLKGSTAVAGSRKQDRNRQLFVSTNGGIAQYASGDITVPGKVISIKFR